MIEDEIQRAYKLRHEWMTLYGLSMNEILESCVTDPPKSVVEEQEELDAVLWCQQNTPSSQTLSSWAQQT